jgi:uncharacterized membrane protein
MNRADFLTQFRYGLGALPRAEIDDILADYESHFADGAADGRSQEEIAAALGDPVRLARELRAEAGFRRWENNRSPDNFLAMVLALLGLAAIDLAFLFPLLCALAGIFFGLAVGCLALFVGGAFLLFNLLPLGWRIMPDDLPFQTIAGIGLVAGGIGGGALLLLVFDWIARILIRYARLHYRLFNSANNAI